MSEANVSLALARALDNVLLGNQQCSNQCRGNISSRSYTEMTNDLIALMAVLSVQKYNSYESKYAEKGKRRGNSQLLISMTKSIELRIKI